MSVVAPKLDEGDLPYPRAVQFPPKAPVFLVEDCEIPNLRQLPCENELPFSGFVDIEGRVHFEVNHWSQTYSKFDRLLWFFRPSFFLNRFRYQIIKNSLLRTERTLLGGVVGSFIATEKKATIFFLGLLPPVSGVSKTQRTQRYDEVRKEALKRLATQLDRFLVWLGADYVETNHCSVPREKMKKIGWFPKALRWKEKIHLLLEGFPVSLSMRSRIYRKDYGSAQLDKESPPITMLGGELIPTGVKG